MIYISIITICRNAESEISKTIESVLNQKYDLSKIELIIVDGKSTDQTINIVNSFKEKSKSKNLGLRINSEPDKGIYDAMNKGANLASGKWSIYLNAGDYFFDENAVNILSDALMSNFDIIYGDSLYTYKNSFKIVKAKPETEINYLNGMEFCHQSCAIRTEYLKAHPYSLEFKIAGDCDFFTRAYVGKARFRYVRGIISVFDKNGISSSNGALVIKENAEIKYKYRLITQSEYKKISVAVMKKIKIRNLIPSFILKVRHEIIMSKATRDWKTWDEIRNLYRYEMKL